MQFTTVVALLVAAVGINAAPAMEKRLDSIPYSIFGGAGCNSSPTPLTTAYIPTDGSCFGISPLVSGDTDSGLIDQTKLKTLPAGCTLIAYSDSTCSSQNFIPYSATGQCATFGTSKPIRSAKTQGTCA